MVTGDLVIVTFLTGLSSLTVLPFVIIYLGSPIVTIFVSYFFCSTIIAIFVVLVIFFALRSFVAIFVIDRFHFSSQKITDFDVKSSRSSSSYFLVQRSWRSLSAYFLEVYTFSGQKITDLDVKQTEHFEIYFF